MCAPLATDDPERVQARRALGTAAARGFRPPTRSPRGCCCDRPVVHVWNIPPHRRRSSLVFVGGGVGRPFAAHAIVLAIVRTAAIFGVDAYPVRVEVDVSDRGLPAVTMVGLPDASVRESRDRVQSAIRNSGFEFPQRRVTVNLSPADIRKVGSAFDLPIAIGVLAAVGMIPTRQIDDAVVLGELSLDGAVRSIRGALPVSARARRDGVGCVILPRANAGEAAIVAGLEVVPVTSLEETASVLTGRQPRPTPPAPTPPAARDTAADRQTCAARRSPDARSKLPPPAATTCCSSARPVRARACWPGACPASCRRSPLTKRSRRPPFIRSRGSCPRVPVC